MALQKLNKGEIWRRKYIVLSQVYRAYSSIHFMGRCVHVHTHICAYTERYMHTHIYMHMNSFMAGVSKWQGSHRISNSFSWHASRFFCRVKTCCYTVMSFNFLANCWQKIMKSQGTKSTLRLQGKVKTHLGALNNLLNPNFCQLWPLFFPWICDQSCFPCWDILGADNQHERKDCSAHPCNSLSTGEVQTSK